MLRVVLDTNVLISALLFSGPPYLIVQGILGGEWLSVTSSVLLDELRGVLLSKFRYPHSVVELMIAEWQGIGVLIEPTVHLSLILEDPADNRVLECALAGHADCIISGDRHLKTLSAVQGIPILSPRAFLEQFPSRHR